jgi:hypothetical protein
MNPGIAIRSAITRLTTACLDARLPLRVFLVLILMFPAAPLFADENRDTLVAATDRFEFHSNPRVALHHFLIAWAAADHDEWPPYALPIAERGYWRIVLDDEDERAWMAAAEVYAASRGRSVVFDQGLIVLRDWAAGTAAKEPIAASDRLLADALEEALPLYQRHWWPAHDTQNRAWIESLSAALRAIENDVPQRLEAAYGGRWPDARIPVDVVVYCNPVGAYSTGGRVTISGADFGNGMPQALELIFHEASHVESLESPLTTLVQEAFRAAGGEAPERFWHDLIFFTTGTITQIALDELGQHDYRHYGEVGVYQRGERWAAQLPLLEQYWQPFLESGSADADERRAALEAVAERLLSE